MSEIARLIGERIRSARNRAGYSQETLGEKAGLHPTYIGQLERGEKNATLESIEKVARALGISFELLFANIVEGDAENAVAAECYHLIDSLPISEQKALLELIKKTIDYKKI